MVQLDSTPLAQPPDPGPDVPVNLDPNDLYKMAEKFIGAQKTCSGIQNTLYDTLDKNRATFGKDGSADEFALVHYNVAADAVFAGFVEAHRLFGKIGHGLGVSAKNHHAADASVLHPPIPLDPSNPDPPSPLNPELDILKRPYPGIQGSRPGWLPDEFVPYWPVCDEGKASAIQAAYNKAYSDFAQVVDGLHVDLQAMIKNNDSADLREFGKYFPMLAGDESTFFVAFAALINRVSVAQNDYSQKIKDSTHDFEAAVKDAASCIIDQSGGKANFDSPPRDLSWQDVPTLLQGKYSNEVKQGALPKVTELAKTFRDKISAPGPIKDARGAADAFTNIMNNVPEPNIEPSATQLGDHILAAGENTGPQQDGGLRHIGRFAGPSMGAIVGAAGYPRMSGTKPVTGTTGGKVTGKDGSHTDVPGGTNPILDEAEAQRADQQLNQLSAADRQRFEQLLATAKSPQEQAYLMKTLAAGHSVDEIASFDNLIHNHGDDPAWLQQHLTPMTNGDAQHPDFTYQGASWTQGQYPATVAASTVLARAMVDPSYTLRLTTGNQPDDPTSTSKEAFLERLRAEQQNVYDPGSTGGEGTNDSSQTSAQTVTGDPDNAPGPDATQGQDITSGDVGTGDGQNFQYQDVSASTTDRHHLLASVIRAVDEGTPVPIQAQGTGASQQMVIIGHRGNQLEVYNPSGEITWISEDDFVNATMNPVGGGMRSPEMTTT